jgi:hypothetical protein
MVDGLRVGEIAKDLLGGLDDDILTLRHGVPRLDWPGASALLGERAPFLALHDGEKPPP